jgi:hypothetical protein
VFVRREYSLCNLPLLEVHSARERARRGDRDDAILVMRAAVDHLYREGRLLMWSVPATGVLVETLLDQPGGFRPIGNVANATHTTLEQGLVAPGEFLGGCPMTTNYARASILATRAPIGGRDPALQRYEPSRSSASARCQFASSVPPSPDWEMW